MITHLNLLEQACKLRQGYAAGYSGPGGSPVSTFKIPDLDDMQ